MALLSGAGCGKSPGPPSEAETALRKLAVQYGQYVIKHKGQSPPHVQAFKDFIKKNAAVPVEDVEQFFVSNRDNLPYVVIYNQKMGIGGPGASQVIAYEKEGVGGKRLVALATTQTEEVDEARFKELVP